MFTLNRVMLHKLVASGVNVHAFLCGKKYKLKFNDRGILCKVCDNDLIEIPVNDSFEIILD